MDRIVTLEGYHLELFCEVVMAADKAEARQIKVCVDEMDGGVKLKVNNGVWTPALGTIGEH